MLDRDWTEGPRKKAKPAFLLLLLALAAGAIVAAVGPVFVLHADAPLASPDEGSRCPADGSDGDPCDCSCACVGCTCYSLATISRACGLHPGPAPASPREDTSPGDLHPADLTSGIFHPPRA